MGCTKSTVPVIVDAIWVDLIPRGTDPVPAKLSDGGISNLGLGRSCTNRHGKETHVGYADGHAEKNPLENLWMLSWNKQFEKRGDIRIDYSQK